MVTGKCFLFRDFYFLLKFSKRGLWDIIYHSGESVV